MTDASDAPGIMQVYGCSISYYTGKLEAYLRYRSIPYESLPTITNEEKLIAGAGVVQMPVVQLADGRWMTDTTPMIAWLESEHSGPSIFPTDPRMRFIALLIEDYADEWLWRSAMHYRWSYRLTRQYAAEVLYQDLVKDRLPIPRWLALFRIKRRQLNGFVRGDGVSAKSRFHADRTYLTALECLQRILEKRPFILGQAPTIADFGMMAPMFRHFGQDPTPAEIMRNQAPAVYAWVARMWNVKASESLPDLIAEPDDELKRFLVEISETHLSQLRQNAEAFGRGDSRYDQRIQDCDYRQVPCSRYRVWCLEKLRDHWAALDAQTQAQLKQEMASPDASILWDNETVKASGYDSDEVAPFNRAINVFGTGVPPR